MDYTEQIKNMGGHARVKELVQDALRVALRSLPQSQKADIDDMQTLLDALQSGDLHYVPPSTPAVVDVSVIKSN